MKVGTYNSLTEMVKQTPKFGASELKTFQDAARTIVDEAESVVLAGKNAPTATASVDMRDLQQALREGFPCVLHGNGTRELKAKLPMDLFDTLGKVNESMPLYLTLTLANIPPPVADTVVVPSDDKGQQISISHVSATERMMDRLEEIRNDIDRALVPEDKG
jgi:hypothetical protein